MNFIRYKSSFFFILILVTLSCGDSSEPPEFPDLKIYLDRFEQEAKNRGYELDLSGIETAYVDVIRNNLSTMAMTVD